ncbi:MAG: peptide-methionine (S)-S-oxide reductase MsrA [Acidobacteriia bacterium]|nr:peptide-methionine (S)-S-oxide reductase MsrA [Terriglobia bacterium]
MERSDRGDRRVGWVRSTFLLSAVSAVSAFLFFVQAARISAAPQDTREAIFAGGCFWSMEHVFDELPGVVSVTTGYAGGTAKRPSYEQVEAGITGHAESVRVVYDPKKIAYDALLDAYWHNTDPTTAAGQFCDFGTQYRPIIFYGDETQKAAAERSKAALEASHRFKRVLTEIQPVSTFWPAEPVHQHYYKTHAAAYQAYRIGCGRDARLTDLWGARR